MPTKRAFLRTLAASLCIPPAVPAVAETYPSHALTLIVPFPAGGPTDVLARIVAARLKDALGQTVVVDNVSGAGGTIAVAKAVRSPADGYTLSIGQLTSHVMSGAAYTTNYDLLKDLEPVAMLTTSPLWVIGRNTLPGSSLQDVVAWLKANPDKASVATIGTGSPAHVWAVFFQEQTGTRFQLVPYRGAAPAIQDMTAGRIDLASLEASSTLALREERPDQGFRHAHQVSLGGGARRADDRRVRPAGPRDALSGTVFGCPRERPGRSSPS